MWKILGVLQFVKLGQENNFKHIMGDFYIMWGIFT